MNRVEKYKVLLLGDDKGKLGFFCLLTTLTRTAIVGKTSLIARFEHGTFNETYKVSIHSLQT